MSLLIDASQRNGMSHQDKMWLNGDALTIIVAGRLVRSHVSHIKVEVTKELHKHIAVPLP